MLNLNPKEFTHMLLMEAGMDEFEIKVRPGTDLDGRFTAWVPDDSEFIRVDGWNCIFHNV